MKKFAGMSAYDLAKELVRANDVMVAHINRVKTSQNPDDRKKMIRLRRKVDVLERAIAVQVIRSRATSDDTSGALDFIVEGVIDAILRNDPYKNMK